jgi:hypothetical protein
MNRLAIATSLFSFFAAAAGLFLQIASPSAAPLPDADFALAQFEPERRRPHRDFCTDFEPKLAAGLAFIKAKLEIAVDQQPIWDRFVAAAETGVDPLRRECAATSGPIPATFPVALARLERRATGGLAAMQRVRPAIDELYDHLTPAQQDSVDALLARMP